MSKGLTTPIYLLDKSYRVIIPTRKDWEEDWPRLLRKGQVWSTNGACNQRDVWQKDVNQIQKKKLFKKKTDYGTDM